MAYSFSLNIHVRVIHHKVMEVNVTPKAPVDIQVLSCENQVSQFGPRWKQNRFADICNL